MTSAQERAILNSTLACMIKSMTGVRTTVELRNESFVSGKVHRESSLKWIKYFIIIILSDCSFWRLHEHHDGECVVYRCHGSQIQVWIFLCSEQTGEICSDSSTRQHSTVSGGSSSTSGSWKVVKYSPHLIYSDKSFDTEEQLHNYQIIFLTIE